MENNNLPEFVSGIPTAKNQSRERRNLIAKYYENLWKRLQREGHNNRIYNDYLGVDVFIIQNESDKKTINAASRNWQDVHYLNFKVKLTIGIRSNNKHVQYCVNKIEINEKKPTVPSNSN